MDTLAELLSETAEPEAPPIIWKATETNTCHLTRDEAASISRNAARPGGQNA
jgi:hypothetical protein